MSKHAFTTCLGLALASSLLAQTGTNRLTGAQRVEADHMRAARASLRQAAAQRQPVPLHGVYQDFRAQIDVPVQTGSDAERQKQELVQAARLANVHVIIVDSPRGSSAENWRGRMEGVLFMAGERDEKANAFVIHDSSHEGQPSAQRGPAYLLRPEGAEVDGAETFQGMALNDAAAQRASAWSQLPAAQQPAQPASPSAAMPALFQEDPDAWLGAWLEDQPAIRGFWDGILAKRAFSGVAVGALSREPASKGAFWNQSDLAFRQISTHIWARELSEPAVLQALREGRTYVAYDWMGDPTGFICGAVNNLGVYLVGDSIPLAGKTRVMAMAPVPVRWRLWHGGSLLQESSGVRLEQEVKEWGAYRVEAWMTVDGEERPWIFASPVYVTMPNPLDAIMPSGKISPEVEAVKDLVYTDGAAEDAAKHQLDLYLPKGKKDFPVIFFVHGGAWKYGDRSQYPAIGNRFAKHGIGFVAPSYRLAPKHPHPAQMEDVAAAFHWTMQHLAERGADLRRVYLAGHSAGGHLVSLLALDPRWLGKYGRTAESIRGVVAMSGVYDLSMPDVVDAVFGKDAAGRRAASPLTYVRSSAPPFLVTYCQWDYLMLPAQAIQFEEALRQAGVNTRLLYVPKDNHIFEMVNVTKENNTTAQAIERFIQ